MVHPDEAVVIEQQFRGQYALPLVDDILDAALIPALNASNVHSLARHYAILPGEFRRPDGHFDVLIQWHDNERSGFIFAGTRAKQNP